MKKRLFISIAALTLSALLCTAGCNQGGTDSSSVSSVSEVSPVSDESAEESSEASEEETKSIQEQFDEELDKINYSGVVYATKGGEVVAVYSKGQSETDVSFSVDTPMPVGSVSKQFCAAAILHLRDQGKLSTDDTLAKYFPEYTQASEVTLKQVLSMRGGIPDIDENIYSVVSNDNTEEQNDTGLQKWLFSKPLDFEPDSGFGYSNAGYYLLALIVEQVSGQKYIDYIRENFFVPLGMENTFSVTEMVLPEEAAKGIKYEHVDRQPGITDGAGDIISTGEDMTKWLRGLAGGKVISAESYEEMTTDYTPGEGYGYGIRTKFFGGIGHPGQIGDYFSADLIIPDKDITLFFSSNTINISDLNSLLTKLPAILRRS